MKKIFREVAGSVARDKQLKCPQKVGRGGVVCTPPTAIYSQNGEPLGRPALKGVCSDKFSLGKYQNTKVLPRKEVALDKVIK